MKIYAHKSLHINIHGSIVQKGQKEPAGQTFVITAAGEVEAEGSKPNPSKARCLATQ